MADMDNPKVFIFDELADKSASQADVALTYAYILCRGLDGEVIDWPRINAAIEKRWKGKGALERVKRMAWAYIEPPMKEVRDAG